MTTTNKLRIAILALGNKTFVSSQLADVVSGDVLYRALRRLCDSGEVKIVTERSNGNPVNVYKIDVMKDPTCNKVRKLRKVEDREKGIQFTADMWHNVYPDLFMAPSLTGPSRIVRHLSD